MTIFFKKSPGFAPEFSLIWIYEVCYPILFFTWKYVLTEYSEYVLSRSVNIVGIKFFEFFQTQPILILNHCVYRLVLVLTMKMKDT